VWWQVSFVWWKVSFVCWYVSFAEYCLFYMALLQKRPIILKSLLVEANPYRKGLHSRLLTNSFLYDDRSLLCVNRSLLCVGMSLLCCCRSLLYVDRSLLCCCRSLLYVDRSLLCVYRSDYRADFWKIPPESRHDVGCCSWLKFLNVSKLVLKIFWPINTPNETYQTQKRPTTTQKRHINTQKRPSELVL